MNNQSFLLGLIESGVIPVKGERERSLLRYLSILLTVKGQTDKEDEVCNWVKNEILRIKREEGKEDISFIETRLEKELGVIVKIPARKEAKYRVLLDAHVDTVVKFKPRFKPLYFSQKCGKIMDGMERFLVRAGGLDNRLHCAALLNMIRFVRYDHIEYFAFFSIAEESGSKVAGAAKFTANVRDILPDYERKRFDLIIVLDCSRGRLFPYIHESSVEGISIIGNGCHPPQKYPPISKDYNINLMCNVSNFKNTKVKRILNHTPRVRFGCCCSENDMHNYRSFASVSDLFDFFQWIELEFPSLMNENESFFLELMRFTSRRVEDNRAEFRKFFDSKVEEIVLFLKNYDTKKRELEELSSQPSDRNNFILLLNRLKTTTTTTPEGGRSEEDMFDIISELLEWEKREYGWFVDYNKLKREDGEQRKIVEAELEVLSEERFKLIMIDLNGTYVKSIRFYAREFVEWEWKEKIPEFIQHADFGPDLC